MPAIGVALCKWTLHLLLFCSAATCTYGEPTNETTIVDSVPPTASSITGTHTTSTSAPSPTLSTRLASRAYSHNATCPFRTINYITHTLPQQCAKTSWSAPAGVLEPNVTIAEAEATPEIRRHGEGGAENGTIEERRSEEPGSIPQAEESFVADSAPPVQATVTEPDQELETDSPLDNANFLSFEDWKQKNLAQVGQSPENIGQGRPAQNQPARRRPVNVNALDSLGDEAEIELDFSGFVNPNEAHSSADRHAGRPAHGSSSATEDDKKAAPSSWALSKDAGKTCKERFNYASFDCAATVLKTNKQAKSATSVLVENKDSYMLNVCSAENKFFIVELCDDILVDTVVLANYEFFSSMFRHFRISVSDRYPVKMERWRTLATFEARNSRDIQPFLITEPQIWARYLRVEFLTHYGNEFYCPMSLLRVHGTTMMEQFRREEEEARGVDDDVDLEATEDDVVKPAIDSGPIPPAELPIAIRDAEKGSEQTATGDVTASRSIPLEQASSSSARQTSSVVQQDSLQDEPAEQTTEVQVQTDPTPSSNHSSALPPQIQPDNAGTTVESLYDSNRTSTAAATPTQNSEKPPSGQTTASGSADVPSSVSVPQSKSNPVVSDMVPRSQPSKAPSNNSAVGVQSLSRERPAGTQPSAPVPSTQESFYKSIHKRLTHLEANSTLSLQYIEEQSRILRDAFKKVEQRQLAKTEKFLTHLNGTVMQELRNFRTLYDQLWQSTVIELESMKERQNTEMNEIGTRLTLMADELVWQKRMAVVQSTLLLLCLGLVLFVRSGTLGSTTDVPIVQQLGNKYSSFFEPSPPRSPPESGIARRRRTFRNMWRSDTSAGLSDRDHPSDAHNIVSDDDGVISTVNIEYSPPTPDGITPTDQIDDPLDDQAQRLEVLETQSGPATPNGTRDSRPSWEEVNRAMDILKVEQGESTVPQQQQQSIKERKRDRKKKKKSPLRNRLGDAAGGSGKRVEGDENDVTDSGNELFLSEV